MPDETKHRKAHAADSAADHTLGSLTTGKLVEVGDGTPPFVDSANTGAEVASAVSASHARQHAIDAAADHTGQGDIVTHNAAEFEAAGVSLLLTGGTMTGRRVPCVLTATSLSGTYNNYNPAGFSNCEVLKVCQDALSGGVNFTGFAAATEGTEITIYNADPTLNVTLKHNDAGSDMVNRIIDPGGADIVMIPYARLAIMYLASRWRPDT